MSKQGVTPAISTAALDQASTWFVEFNEDEAGASERSDFVRWLRASPENVRGYLAVSAAWESACLLEGRHTIDVEKLVARACVESNVIVLNTAEAHDEGDSVPQRSAAATVRRSRSSPLARATLISMAACIVIAVAAVSIWDSLIRGVHATSVGEQRSVVLADGSTMELNSRTRLRVRFSDRERLIDLLEGQAMFRVATDPKRPFVVRAEHAQVRAVGTLFDVYRQSSGTITVTVIEGRVAVQARRPTEGPNDGGGEAATRPVTMLGAGEQVSVTATSIPPPRAANIAAATAWTQRQIVFQGALLTEVVEEFNRYNTRQMRILDPSLARVRISGVFASTDPASLLRFLRELPDFSVDETTEEIRISRAERSTRS